MIAPDFRLTDNLQLVTPCKNFISANYSKRPQPLTWCLGNDMWNQMEPFIANVEKTHNQMSTVAAYRTNYQQLV
jgi:hypothetical protein